MSRFVRFLVAFAGLVLLAEANAEAKKPARPAAPPAEEAAPAEKPSEAAPPVETPAATPPATDEGTEAAADPDPAAGVPAVSAEAESGPRQRSSVFGIATRGRFVSVPSWLLGLFLRQNVPLFTLGHVGLEGYWRRNNFQIAVAVSYQNMSPPNGNWLNSDQQMYPADANTSYVRFKDFSLIAFDISFTWYRWFTSWMGMHYGAGFGAAIVRGKILHNDDFGCNETNAGNLSQCHPTGVTCANGTCTPESALTPPNAAYAVPPAIPIVNAVLGLDFRVPSLRGWEARIEGGFYDAFFFGGAVGYTF